MKAAALLAALFALAVCAVPVVVTVGLTGTCIPPQPSPSPSEGGEPPEPDPLAEALACPEPDGHDAVLASDPLGYNTAPVGGLVCPLPGSVFGDTWHAPRSGGRLHKGTDMVAPHGQAIVAPEAGQAEAAEGRLAGLYVRLYADSGRYWIFAHASAVAVPGPPGIRVDQGDVIAFNGDSGNATGIPHAHVQLHPGGRGSEPVNPYPVLAAACGLAV